MKHMHPFIDPPGFPPSRSKLDQNVYPRAEPVWYRLNLNLTMVFEYKVVHRHRPKQRYVPSSWNHFLRVSKTQNKRLESD